MLAINLAGNFSAGDAILAGIVGALAMLVVMYGGRAMGMTSMDLLRTLGTMMVPKASAGMTYGIGMMMHLMMGAGFGLLHAGVLHAVDPSSDGDAVVVGLVAGVVHGMVVAGMMPTMLTTMHPLVKSGQIYAPGPFMTGMGKMTPMGMIMAHVVFSIVAGAIYVAAVG